MQSLKSIIQPGTIKVLGSQSFYARRVYILSGEALEYSDRALLAYCEYTPEFGGHVEREAGRVLVHVNTD